jgi:hypothetical protein
MICAERVTKSPDMTVPIEAFNVLGTLLSKRLGPLMIFRNFEVLDKNVNANRVENTVMFSFE